MYWRFWEDGKLEFPDGSKFGDPEGPGTTGFLAADDNSFLIETNNTSNNPSVFSVWEFTKDGALVFPDGTITSGTISGTVNFGFDTRATENGFSILTGTSTGTAQLWTFDTNGVLNLPAGGDIKIGGSSVLSSGVNLMTEEFIVNLTPQSSNFGFDYINGTNYNVSGATPDRLMFPLQEVPQSLHQIVIYLDGRRIPKYDSSNQPLYYISGSAVVLIHDNFNYLIYDEGQDHIYRINIDYQY